MSSFARRGRPPSSSLEQRSLEGMTSTSRIKCQVCHRVFPRPKSLRAHMYIHTGEKPFECDYPGCEKAFKQSGQLRNHIYLHTGEKPFRCPVDDCGERFTHSNRHCPVHDPLRQFKVIRDGNEFIDVKEENLSEEQQQWLQVYRNKKYNSRGMKSPAENDSDEENIPVNNKRTSDDKNKKYNSRGTKRPAENSSDEENIPVNNRRTSDDEYISALSESSSSSIYKNDESSYSSSESSSSSFYKNESSYSLSESSSSSFCKYDMSTVEAVHSLLLLNYGHFRQNF